MYDLRTIPCAHGDVSSLLLISMVIVMGVTLLLSLLSRGGYHDGSGGAIGDVSDESGDGVDDEVGCVDG